MTNYSRTTLRELKKRYLNILKKCLLANLLAFSFVLPVQAETTEPTLTPSEELETVVKDSSNFSRTEISSDTTIDLAGKNLTYTGISSSGNGSVFYVNNGSTLEFINSSETTDPLLLFKDNTASKYCGAICNSGYITFGAGSTATFTGNTASSGGGAIGSDYGTITFSEGATATFTGNTSSSSGGAIFNYGDITFGAGSTATFSGNTASYDGGAIENYGYITFGAGSTATFSGNTASYDGGAIYNGGLITFGEGSTATFSGNEASQYGGVIYNVDGSIIFNGETIFSENEASVGGTIYNYRGTITFGEGSTATFICNKATAAGGAIFNNADITFGEGSTATFSGNTASIYGGAIYNLGAITFDEGSTATFTGNTASSAGGAIYNGIGGLITFNNSYFSNNFAQSESGEAEGGAIYNEGTLTFNGENIFENNKTNGKLNDIHNVGSILVKGSLITNGGVTGNGKITIDKDGVLDIKTGTVEVGEMTLKDGALLKIGINSLTEHGKVNGLVTGSETSKIALNLEMDTKNGIYQVFDEDNNLTLQENKLFNIKDLENGAYEVSKKTSENLMKDFDMSASESAVAVALIESESTHKAFNQMQEEMLEALQSEDKAQVQKAKKALKAVGTSEQPSSQSIAASHFNELTRVISQMAMEKEAEVGHSGGEEAPRAKVYIKGLYDRTKSSQGEGFRARSKGAVLGIQSEVTDALTLGVGYATSQTTAKEDLRRTEVDTNTGFISAHYQPNAWWVSGLATFSRGEYEEEKQILSSVGKATYDVDSWGAQVMTGYDIKLENAIITPEVGLRYLSVKQEGYTDTLGTTVTGTQSDYLTALVGIKGTWDMGAIRPTAGVTVGYDIISDDVSALNALANGASYTVNGEALDRLSTGVSLGIEADLGDRTTLKLEYSGTFRKEYADHSGMLKLEVKF